MIRFTKIALLSLSILSSQLCLASSSGPFNYFQSPPAELLANIEKFHLAQGIEKAKEGKFEYAWSEFAFLLHYFPNHAGALKLISDLSLQMKQTQRARKYFERALKLYPDEPITYSDYGNFLIKIAEFEEAITQYKRALAFDESNSYYHYQLGLAYFAIQNYALANRFAQNAYQHGMHESVLKEKLVSVNAWKPTKRSS